MRLDPRIPKKVRIAGITYDVRSEEDLYYDAGANAQAHITRQAILVDTHAAGDWQCQAFLHEVVHILNEQLTLGLDEEKVVRTGHGLFGMLTDNKLAFVEKPTMKKENAK